MYVAAHHHRVGLCRQSSGHRTDVVLAVICHDIVGGDECRHISACLLGQIGVYLPIVLAALRAVDGLVDLVGTAVVGCNHQIPVAEHLIQVAQIIGCGIRSLDGVASLIHEGVHLQSVALAGGEHKLPQSRCSHSRHRRGVESRLNHGQVFQFERQSVCFESLLEYRHVEVRRSKHITNGVAQTSAIAVDEFLYHLIVWHFDDARYALEPVDIHFLLEYGVDVLHSAVVVLAEIVLRHVEVEQTVEFEGHSLGKFDYFFLTIVVGDGDFVLVAFVVFFYLCLYGNIACQ